MIDLGALFSQLFSTCWWLLPLFIVAALFKSAWLDLPWKTKAMTDWRSMADQQLRARVEEIVLSSE